MQTPVLLGATVQGGGAQAPAPTNSPTDFSPVAAYTAGNHPLGNYTYGRIYGALAAVSVTGMEFRQYDANWANVTAKIRRGGSVLATKVVSTGAAGVYTATWDSPVAIAIGEKFSISLYDGGTRYITGTAIATDAWIESYSYVTGGGKLVAIAAHCMYASGDAEVVNPDANARFPGRVILA